jgi:hypothetical protein
VAAAVRLDPRIHVGSHLVEAGMSDRMGSADVDRIQDSEGVSDRRCLPLVLPSRIEGQGEHPVEEGVAIVSYPPVIRDNRN